MPNAPTNEELVRDIQARLTTMGEQTSEARINQLVQTYLDKLFGAEGGSRKFRFGGAGDPKLAGSKFARWGLTLADIEWAHDVLTSAARMGRSNGPSEELRKAFTELSEAAYVPEATVREWDKRAIDDMFPKIPRAWLSARDAALHGRGQFEQMDAYQRALGAINMRTSDSGQSGAMDTADSGYGSQLIGAQYVRELWEAARTESRVFVLLDSFEMTDPVAYLPVEADLPEMLFVAENTIRDPSAYTPKKTGSNRVTVTAYKFIIRQIYSGEMEEDSIIPLVPYYRRQAQLSLAHYADSAVLNGDTTTGASPDNINIDSDPVGTEKHYLAFDGMRHAGLVDNTANQKDLAGVITLDALMAAKGRMVDETYLQDWGHPTDPKDLVYVADPYTGDSIAMIDEIKAWRQFQGNSPLLNGQVGDMIGHPIISSMAVKKSLATGFVHASTGNSYGTVQVFNRRGFKVGWRRRVRTEFERYPGLDQSTITYSLRFGFGRYSPTGAASGLECADTIYDVTL